MGMILVHPENKTQFGAEERVVIQADTLPETMPTTGRNVTGLPDGCAILPASLMYVLATGKKYAMDSEGEWQEIVGSAGGGGGYPEPSGVLQVTSNGLIDVKDWAQANVNVSANGLGVHDIRFVHGSMNGYSASSFFTVLENDAKSLSEDEIKFRMIVAGENDYTVSVDYDGSNTDLADIGEAFSSYQSIGALVDKYDAEGTATIEVYLPYNMTTFDANLLNAVSGGVSKLYIRGDASMYSNCNMDDDNENWSNCAFTDVYVPWSQTDRDISTETWFQNIGHQTSMQQVTAHYNATYDPTTGEYIVPTP